MPDSQPKPRRFGDVRSVSPAMDGVFTTLKKVARHNLNVLLTGPSGVGKTRMARALHKASPRGKAPFVVVDCGSVPDNLIESELFGHTEGAFTGAVQAQLGAFRGADGGTLLLDEIGAASPAMQVAMLRALESGRVTPLGSSQSIAIDVRVIATTSRDLKAEIEGQRFRPDLYYRLAVIVQELPTLQARVQDIPLLADEMLAVLAEMWNTPQLRLARATLHALQARAWPGNIRELENVLKRGAVLAEDDQILPRHLAPTASTRAIAPSTAHATLDGEWIRSGPVAIHRDTWSLPVLREHLEALAIERALEACDQNQSRAAQLLDMPRRTLVYKLTKKKNA